jgi:acyl-coenzyme A synthetase/AMP-(fatty) acid ligase
VTPHERRGYALGAAGRIQWGDQTVGYVGLLDKKVAQKLSLREVPAIAEAAVVGVADPKWGEAACAAVVLKPGTVLVEPEVRKLFEERLARYKHPRRIVPMASLPKNALGKVQKAELRRLLDGQLHGANPL